MSDFELFDPHAWVDDSGILIRSHVRRSAKGVKKLALDAVRNALAGTVLAATVWAPSASLFAYSGDSVVHSEVRLSPKQPGALPDGYWEGLLAQLKRAPVVDDVEIENGAAPVL